MDNAAIKKEFKGYRKAKKEWDRLNRQIEEIETQITSISIDYSRERVQSSNINHDKVAEVIDRLSALREKAIDEADKMTAYMVKTFGRIDKLEDETERDIMQRRYVEGLSWEEICVAIGFSWAQVHRYHRAALEHLGNAKEV